jgi:hypothetical protein
LGLRHNFGSSSTVPVDSLRNKKWVEAHGHTPSIMDYARFNYIAQPEDSINETGLFPRIGDYDHWAIEWGYRWYGNTTVEEDVPVLNKLTIERLKNKRLWFGTEETPVDPRCQNEDLGDNAVKAGEYGIKNLKRIVPNLVEWTKTPNEGYENLADVYKLVNRQFDRYIIHVLKNIAGVYATPKTSEQNGPLYEQVPVQKQKEAVAFIDKYVLTTPMWLYDAGIFEKTGENFMGVIMERQGGLINALLDTYRFSRMLINESVSNKPVYTLHEFLNDLDHAALRELYTAKPIDMYRRNLQKIYIDKLISTAFPNNKGGLQDNASSAPQSTITMEILPVKYSDISSILQAQLKDQLQLLKKALALTADKATREHIEDMIARINNAFKQKN